VESNTRPAGQEEENEMISIGIDPGKSGYVVMIHDVMGIILHRETPIIKVGKTKPQFDVSGMAKTLDDVRMLKDADGRFLTNNSFVGDITIIEKQQAMPGQGVSSTFQIGYGFGLWEGIVAEKGIPYVIVHPRTWKKEMLRDIPGTDQKGRSIIAAQRLYPNFDLKRTERCRKPDHNKAEALLLARYGMDHLHK